MKAVEKLSCKKIYEINNYNAKKGSKKDLQNKKGLTYKSLIELKFYNSLILTLKCL